jgi:DNA helicase-2/ATP-dependent DNA helicase PcrA
MVDRPSYLPDWLTNAQREAIFHRGSSLLIVAGPGSGKTEVISWRAAHLVHADHVAPQHLLVVTFTNKAALELKDRIQDHLPGVHVEQQMWVSTFHAFCAELLRRFRSASVFPQGFQTLDATGQLLFVFANRKTLGLSNHPEITPQVLGRIV